MRLSRRRLLTAALASVLAGVLGHAVGHAAKVPAEARMSGRHLHTTPWRIKASTKVTVAGKVRVTVTGAEVAKWRGQAALGKAQAAIDSAEHDLAAGNPEGAFDKAFTVMWALDHTHTAALKGAGLGPRAILASERQHVLSRSASGSGASGQVQDVTLNPRQGRQLAALTTRMRGILGRATIAKARGQVGGLTYDDFEMLLSGGSPNNSMHAYFTLPEADRETLKKEFLARYEADLEGARGALDDAADAVGKRGSLADVKQAMTHLEGLVKIGHTAGISDILRASPKTGPWVGVTHAGAQQTLNGVGVRLRAMVAAGGPREVPGNAPRSITLKQVREAGLLGALGDADVAHARAEARQAEAARFNGSAAR